MLAFQVAQMGSPLLGLDGGPRRARNCCTKVRSIQDSGLLQKHAGFYNRLFANLHTRSEAVA